MSRTECERERDAKIEAYNTLYAKYLRLTADLVQGNADDEAFSKKADEAQEALWTLIRTPAKLAYQIGYKATICRELMTVDWTDSRHRAMFESIVADCGRLGDLGDLG
jgi:hypothetical protein